MATDRRNTAVEDKQELATTIGLYVLGEISLGKAAERTGMIRWEMEELLQKAGVELQLGPQSMDGLDDEVDVALDLDWASRFRSLVSSTQQCSTTTRPPTLSHGWRQRSMISRQFPLSEPNWSRG